MLDGNHCRKLDVFTQIIHFLKLKTFGQQSIYCTVSLIIIHYLWVSEIVHSQVSPFLLSISAPPSVAVFIAPATSPPTKPRRNRHGHRADRDVDEQKLLEGPEKLPGTAQKVPKKLISKPREEAKQNWPTPLGPQLLTNRSASVSRILQ